MSISASLRAPLVLAALLLAGCGTLHGEAKSIGEVTPDSIIVVGRIELVPPLKSSEQDLKMGTFDPLDVKSQLTQRAVLYLATQPQDREPTREALNPELEKLYFVRIPKDSRYIVHGTVLMKHRITSVSRHQVATDTNELLLPAPIELDIRPDDTAIYVGTWRFHRDEFNEVTKVQLINDHSGAAAAFRKKYGSSAKLRPALPKALISR